jgi:8-oxo-dGTP pyrophosphatase MutT (NUDIX family)
MPPDFIQRLKHQLSLPLPGSKAQFLMAPSFRKSNTKTIINAKAGVLLLLYLKDQEWTIVFMKRPDNTGLHSGQISFPGGKLDIKDTDLEQTALRETEEEIGIPPKKIIILGHLTKLHISVSGIEVYPFIGYINTSPTFKINPLEVQYLIEVKISELKKTSARKEKSYSNNQITQTIPYFSITEHEIWGATAMILNEFLIILDVVPLTLIH